LYLSCVFDENNSRRNENGLIKNLHGAIYIFPICKINNSQAYSHSQKLFWITWISTFVPSTCLLTTFNTCSFNPCSSNAILETQ
jgi:hypothetical protein